MIASFPFPSRVLSSRAPERRPRSGERPQDYALELAEKKAREVARRLRSGLVLGADTVVHLGREILGKPRDEADARRMLSLLTGRWHEVHTALCLVEVPGNRVWRGTAATRVRMRKFSDRELDRWAKRNHDKAGAYAAQAQGNPFVVDYRGDFDNVVGLPRRLLRNLLKKVRRGGVRPSTWTDGSPTG